MTNPPTLQKIRVTFKGGNSATARVHKGDPLTGNKIVIELDDRPQVFHTLFRRPSNGHDEPNTWVKKDMLIIDGWYITPI